MKFHPVISIGSGVIVSFTLFFISAILYGYIWFDLSPIISFIFGGFIAVYFAKEKKIQYALYEGIIVLLILEFLTNFVASSYVSVYLVYSVLIILLTIIGGMIGLMMDKNYNGFNPFLALFAGSFIGALCIWITSTHGYNPDSVPIGLIDIIVGIIFFMIGGFLSTILAKERKIQYGIYTGVLILLIIAIVQQLLSQPFVIHILGFVIYIVSAVIGSYLAVVVAKHQQQISNK